MTIRGDGPGPLFLLQDGHPLSRSLLTAWLHRILASAGVPGNFSSHSFRIGAATVAARNSIPDHQIQALGRWSSSAYLFNIWTPAETLSKLSKQLTASAAVIFPADLTFLLLLISGVCWGLPYTGVWLLCLDECYAGGNAPSCLAVDDQPWVARSGSPLVRGLGRFASRC